MGHRHRAAETAAKGGLVLDQLVGGKHHHHRAGVARRHPANAQRNRRRGVPLGGLGENIFRGNGLAQNGPHGLLLFAVGQNEDIFPRHQAF